MTKFRIFRGHKLSRSVCFDKICEYILSYVTTLKDIALRKAIVKRQNQVFFEFLAMIFSFRLLKLRICPQHKQADFDLSAPGSSQFAELKKIKCYICGNGELRHRKG